MHQMLVNNRSSLDILFAFVLDMMEFVKDKLIVGEVPNQSTKLVNFFVINSAYLQCYIGKTILNALK